MEEIKWAVFGMDRDSAAGPGGFTGKFFIFAWDILAQDVYHGILSYLKQVHLFRGNFQIYT